MHLNVPQPWATQWLHVRHCMCASCYDISYERCVMLAVGLVGASRSSEGVYRLQCRDVEEWTVVGACEFAVLYEVSEYTIYE